MASATSKSAPLYVTNTGKNGTSQGATSFQRDITSYFDISPQPAGSTRSQSPPSPADISPGSQPRSAKLTTIRRPYFRFHSDYEALHERLHGRIIEEDQTPENTHVQGFSSPPSQETPRTKTSTGRSIEHSPRRSSWQSSGASTQSSLALRSRSSKESHTYPQRRPKISQIWGTSPSWTAGVEKRNITVESDRRPSSTQSESVTSGGNIILVRTDQTPLRPPQSKSAPVSTKPKASSIKVETEFTDLDINQRSLKKTQSSERRVDSKTQTSEQSRRTSSRRSSISPKHFFSAPLQLLRRASLPKRSSAPFAAKAPLQSPVKGDARMADHNTLLKRNYTSEALQRVAGFLQETKQTSQTSLWPPQVIRPLTWKTFSDKSGPQQAKKGQKTAQGIISGLGNNNQSGSGGLVSEVQSYTSSQRNLRMGIVPTSTPDEKATYKIKRSPSAETEEFLKLDISIRGGTSYLPSEARRIHTPPLPEEGLDGRWKGFFFDYNAPRQVDRLPGSDKVEGGLENGAASLDSIASLGMDRGKLTTGSRPRLERTKSKNKRILAGDWFDVKLAELDIRIQDDQGDINNREEGDWRLNSPDVLSKGQKKMVYDGKEVEPEMFDLTIPEHLPTSPVCPRHPRYWRVAKGKGSQFRGVGCMGLVLPSR